MDQIAAGPEDLTIKDIECPDISVFEKVKEDQEAIKQKISSFLASLPAMDWVDEDVLRRLSDASRIETWMEDDKIIREGGEIKDLLFVFSGVVELFRKGKTGWLNTLMTLGKGKMVSAAGLWEEPHSFMEVRSFSDAEILVIPREAVWDAIQSSPAFAIWLMRELDKRSGVYSLLWVNS